jgi:hypothetical protein
VFVAAPALPFVFLGRGGPLLTIIVTVESFLTAVLKGGLVSIIELAGIVG